MAPPTAPVISSGEVWRSASVGVPEGTPSTAVVLPLPEQKLRIRSNLRVAATIANLTGQAF